MPSEQNSTDSPVQDLDELEGFELFESQEQKQPDTLLTACVRYIHRPKGLKSLEEKLEEKSEPEKLRESAVYYQAEANGHLLEAAASQMKKGISVSPFIGEDVATGSLVIGLDVKQTRVPYDHEAVVSIKKFVNDIRLNASKKLAHTEMLKSMGKVDAGKLNALKQLSEIEVVDDEHGFSIAGPVWSFAFTRAINEKFISMTLALSGKSELSEDALSRPKQQPVPTNIRRDHV
jgi:hypothetical protein